MATLTLNIGSKEKPTIVPIAVPDKSPLESQGAYTIRLENYLNERFHNGWSRVEHSRAAKADLNALLTVRAELAPSTTGGTLFEQLAQRTHHVKVNKYPKKNK